MFTQELIQELSQIAKDNGLEAAALLAVIAVESAGRLFAIVEGRNEPLIRFEGHYFDRRLSDANREKARKAGLSSPRAGGVANPRTQAARWRLLRAAAAIDRKAAYESTSWGIGQVMGAHWSWLGYDSIDAFMAEARSGAAGQARLMIRFIKKNGLDAALRRHDWEAFARSYNGPGYKANGYHTKMAAAYKSYSALKMPASPAIEGLPIPTRQVTTKHGAQALFSWLRGVFKARA
ncbi:N-acetylmuramidase family protein [Oryzicola mucosus]|uniref:DUF3380 domain-containing protein n=1 Tax=Oryzicola mucosus TaxID=2767425 RepID=A0A8J6TYB5_9HYPH|nr:N-acetylmuramidase family protein [Oryzicola mucosus]MBD0414429.1 DUF3380 domain-containing protein [Oryzicola mucosus]